MKNEKESGKEYKPNNLGLICGATAIGIGAALIAKSYTKKKEDNHDFYTPQDAYGDTPLLKPESTYTAIDLPFNTDGKPLFIEDLMEE